MSASGYKRTFSGQLANVRLTPESRHWKGWTLLALGHDLDEAYRHLEKLGHLARLHAGCDCAAYDRASDCSSLSGAAVGGSASG